MKSYLLFFVLCAGIWSEGSCELKFSQKIVDLISGQCTNVTLHNSDANLKNRTISLYAEFYDTVTVNPSQINIDGANSWLIQVCGQDAGFTVVFAKVEFNNHTTVGYLLVTVSKEELLKWVGDVVGWIYFFAWSVSYYPQIYTNYARKSVVGLNFDFIALNIVGFVLYSAYNCGLYFVPWIQNEYFQRHPKGRSPVLFNDVFFSVHAALATCVNIYQCLIYERGNQRVSFIARLILFVYLLIVLLCGVLVHYHKMSWLEFLLYCSYIKLSVTMIKYIPQAFMNYTRKSTVGWSIGSVWLDFIGGVFSILQMVINGYNFNDWDSFFGDPTKFGLGVFSIAFDVIFLYQHYILYRVTRNYEQQVDGEVHSPDQDSDSSSTTTETRSEQ